MRQFFPEIDSEKLIKRFQSSIMFWFGVFVVAYLIVLLPLSFLNPNTIRTVWDSVIPGIWAISCLFGGWFFMSFVLVKKENEFLYLLTLLGFLFLFGLTLVLGILGLQPSRAFIPTIMAFSLFFVFFLGTLGKDLLLKYKTYLARSIHFAEEAASILILLGLFYLLEQGIQILRTGFSFYAISIPGLVLGLLKIGMTIYFISRLRNFVMNIEVNDRKSFSNETLSLAIAVIVIEIYNWQLYNSLDFWWIGSYALGTSIFYTAQNPTKRKASMPLYLGLILFVFFLLYRMFDVQIKVPFIDVLTDFLLPVVGFLVGSWSLVRKKWFEVKGKTSIALKDVEEACGEIIENDGITFSSLSNILSISIISKHFHVPRRILEKQSMPPELKTYLEIYLLCAEFYHIKKVSIPREEAKKLILDKDEKFRDYINKIFPSKVRNLYLWSTYTRNSYITKYVSADNINNAKPSNLFEKSKRLFSRSVIIIMLISFGLGQVPFPLISLLPSVLGRALAWNNLRITEIQIKFTEAFKPYKDRDFEDYYADRIYEWIEDWEHYRGLKKDGVIFLSPGDIDREIDLLEFLLGFYQKKDDLRHIITKKLCMLLKAADNYEGAIKCFIEAIENTKDIESKDFLLSELAEFYHEKGDNDSAIAILQSIEENLVYSKSRKLLASYYYYAQQFNKSMALFRTFPFDELSTKELCLLGESCYQNSDLKCAKQIFEQMDESEAFEDLSILESLACLRLGQLYLDEDNFFEAAEYLFKSLASILMKEQKSISEQQVSKIIPTYKAAVDTIFQQNPYDYRVNLWYFVYFVHVGEIDSASLYFTKHLQNSPQEYEQEFTEFVLRHSSNKD